MALELRQCRRHRSVCVNMVFSDKDNILTKICIS